MRYVLLVDDDPSQREALRVSIEAQGCVAKEVHDYDEARSAIGEGDFSLVVADADSLSVNAYALLSWSKSVRAELPFVLMGRFESAADSLSAYAKGADDLLCKPFFNGDPWPLLRWMTNSGERPLPPDRASVDGQFARVALDALAVGSPLSLDVYVRLSAAKYVRVERQGRAIEASRTDRYRNRGVRSLFVRRADLGGDSSAPAAAGASG